MSSEPEVWLTIPQACELLHVHRRTIYNWLAKGKLTTRRTAGGTLRILKSSLWTEPERRQVSA